MPSCFNFRIHHRGFTTESSRTAFTPWHETTINAESAEFAECSAVSASSAFNVVTGIFWADHREKFLRFWLGGLGALGGCRLRHIRERPEAPGRLPVDVRRAAPQPEAERFAPPDAVVAAHVLHRRVGLEPEV